MGYCLYNGTKLAVLPEWDKSKKPYSVIMDVRNVDNVTHDFLLWVFDNPIYLTGGEYLSYKSGVNDGYASVYGVNSGDSSWEHINDKSFWDDIALEGAIIWSNHDILNEDDNSVYFLASDPIPILAPTIDPLSLFLGWKAGNWAARQRGKKKTPVAYLYNGVRLPALPEWDKTVYPYSYIQFCGFGFWRLVCHAAPLYAKGETEPDPISGLEKEVFELTEPVLFTHSANQSEWNALEKVTAENAPGVFSGIQISAGMIGDNQFDWGILWTSTDICYTDGTVALAATTPVPVYE